MNPNGVTIPVASKWYCDGSIVSSPAKAAKRKHTRTEEGGKVQGIFFEEKGGRAGRGAAAFSDFL